MYASIDVSNFRGIDQLTLGDFARVNLVAGRNNVGKTTLLESIFLLAGEARPELTVVLNGLRGYQAQTIQLFADAEAPWSGIFRDFDETRHVKISGTDDDGLRGSISLRVASPEDVNTYSSPTVATLTDPSTIADTTVRGAAHVLELRTDRNDIYFLVADENGIRTVPTTPSPPMRTLYLGAGFSSGVKDAAERLSRLQADRSDTDVVEALKIVEPNLRHLAVSVLEGQSEVRADLGPPRRLMPLQLLGGGMVRLANLVLGIGDSRNGVVLIDEIETGLHHSVLSSVWRTIADAAKKYRVQVFATTHSRECIVAAQEAFAHRTSEFALYRLQRAKGHVQAVRYDVDTLQAAIEEDLEVR
jgi:hypothetical protein